MTKKNDLTDDEIIQSAADMQLDEAITITIDVLPKNRIDRVLMWARIKAKKVEFKITGVTLGTLLRCSKLLLQMHYTEKPGDGDGILPWAYKGVIDNLDLAVDLVCAAIHNKKTPVPDYMRELLIENIAAKNLQQIALNIVVKMDVLVFMSTITSIRQIQIMKMDEVSPQPAKTIEPERNKEDMLIDGEQLEALSNIFIGAKIK